MAIGIVGFGVVGKALGRLFRYEPAKGNIQIYDKFVPELAGDDRRGAVQSCSLVFLSVPTPKAPDGSCDVTAVEDVVSWLEPPICLKSTVPPGTVDRLVAQTGKSICFSPEYVGETDWHPWKKIENHGFVIVGGEKTLCDLVVRTYQHFLGPLPRYYMTDAKTAELCKYMENTFLATKVAFVNQFYDLGCARRNSSWVRSGSAKAFTLEECLRSDAAPWSGAWTDYGKDFPGLAGEGNPHG